jgi:hypothetical protein
VDATAYLVPAAGGVLGFAGAAWLLLAWRRRERGSPPPPRPVARATRADELRLEAELDRLR